MAAIQQGGWMRYMDDQYPSNVKDVYRKDRTEGKQISVIRPRKDRRMIKKESRQPFIVRVTTEGG